MDESLMEGAKAIVSEIFTFRKSEFTESEWQKLIDFYSNEGCDSNSELV